MPEQKDSVHRITITLCWNRRGMLGLSLAMLVAASLLAITVALAHTLTTVVPPSPALSAPTVVSYQGRVAVGGQPFTGTGQFKFAIVNLDGTAAYWSNDGSALTTPPFAPASAVALNVRDGYFEVLLGDTSLPNMTQPLKPGAFSAADRALRIWFNDGVNGFQQLAPDVRVASAPYALNAEFARTTPNLRKIAMQKWYTAIDTGRAEFPVGLNPRSIAFDGSNIWVTNAQGKSVSVIRTNDNALIATYPTGDSPRLISYDGANMWVVGVGTINVLRARDGFQVMTLPSGENPVGLAFDGANMWIANNDTNDLTVLRASDGAQVMTRAVGVGPVGVAFDGAKMWVANFGGGKGDTVSVLRASDGAHVMTLTVGLGPAGIGFDGVNMWVTQFGGNGNQAGNSVTVLRASDGAPVATYTVGLNPRNAAFDGTNIWITNYGSDTVSVLRASDGAPVKIVPTGLVPYGLAFDGANMWISNTISNTVSKR